MLNNMKVCWLHIEQLNMGHQVMTSFSFETIGDRKVRKVFLTNQHSCEVKQYKAGLLLTLKRQLHLTKKMQKILYLEIWPLWHLLFVSHMQVKSKADGFSSVINTHLQTKQSVCAMFCFILLYFCLETFNRFGYFQWLHHE